MNAQILRSEDPIEDSHTPSVTPSLFDLRKTEFESGGKARALFSDSPGGSAIDEENRTTLIEALMIYHALEAGRPLGEVARMSENIHAFGIGHFLHNAMTKELLRVEMRPGDLLNLVYLDEAEMRQRDPDRRGAILRHRVIEILRNRKIIAPTYARNLRPAGTTPCLKSIGQLVESTTKIPLEDITSPSRVAGVVQARFQAIWVLRTVCGHSLTMIGQSMGNRDHTTILNSLNKAMLKQQTSKADKDSYRRLCERADTLGVLQNRKLLLRATRHLA